MTWSKSNNVNCFKSKQPWRICVSLIIVIHKNWQYIHNKANCNQTCEYFLVHILISTLTFGSWIEGWRVHQPPSFLMQSPLRLLWADHPECLVVYSSQLVVWCNCAAVYTSQHNGTWWLLIKCGTEMTLLLDSFNRDEKPAIIPLNLPHSLNYILPVSLEI